MISSVTNSLASPAASKAVPPQSEPQAVVNTAQARPDFDYTVSNIRVDVDADLAILEFRSLKTGDIIRQYPTEKQIAGYQRAAQLEASKQSREDLTAVPPTEVQTPAPAPQQAQSQQAAAPETVVAAAPQAPVNVSANAPTGQAGSGVNVNAGTAQLSDTSSVSASA